MPINIKNQGDVGKVSIKGVGDVAKIYRKTATGIDEIWSNAEQISLVPETDADKKALWTRGNGYYWSGNYIGTYYHTTSHGWANSYWFELSDEHKQIRLSVSIRGATNMYITLVNSSGTVVWGMNFNVSGGGTYNLPTIVPDMYYLRLSTSWMHTDRYAQLNAADILLG